MGCCYSAADAQDIDTDVYTKKKVAQEERKRNSGYVSKDELKQPIMTITPAQKLKAEGNEHFKNKNYSKAITSYQQALDISTAPDISYYTNLALAYKASQQYEKSIQTIDTMTTHPSFMSQQRSPLYMKGQITKARSLCLQVKDYCISGSFTIKKNHQFLACINQSIQLLQEVSSNGTTEEYTQFLDTALKVKQFLIHNILPNSQSQGLLNYLHSKFKANSFQFEGSKVSQYFGSRQQMMEELQQTVQKLKKEALQEQKDYLIDPITYEALVEPVIVPSGTTYNKTTLLQHFKNNGYNDPITHQQYSVGEQVVVSNFNIKDYVHSAKKIVTQDDLYLLKY